jgi:hypothetical protein
MRSLLSRATQADTSFSIGLGLIVILAGAEIFAATFYYIGRARTDRASAQAIAATLVRPTIPAASTSMTSAPAPAQTGQSKEAAAPTPLPSLVDQLLREGVELRERGDTTTALARLQEASDSDPTNAAVLEEIAKTYEAMQLFDRSNEMWRKLQEMGPSAGEAYELADRRLKLGVPTAGAGIASASLDPAAPHKDISGGIAEGSTFSITEVKTTETPDPEAETNLTLQIAIKKQPDATIDHAKVKIQVFFYDMVDDRDIKLTDADVNYEWFTPKHDWTETNPEVLSVSYLRPKTRIISPEAGLSEAAASVRPGQKGRPAKSSTGEGGERRYLGYRILLYYDDKLQAVQAEPSRLLQLFPPSERISSR